ncbi:MAG: hypothetical protein KKD92_01855 [Proteobacteria bacterium]|nr:hypothetical protein [Pseudomonadota bacterium]
MLRRATSKISLVIIAALIALPCITHGQVPQPVDVPSELSEQELSALLKQRTNLLGQRDRLEQEIQEQKSQCGNVNVEDKEKMAFCSEWRARLGEKYTNYMNASNSFKQKVIDRMEALIGDLKERLERDVRAVRNLGLERRAEDFEEWEKLAVDSREQFNKQATDSIADLFLSGASDINKDFVKRIGSLNTFSAQKLIGKLNKAGIRNQGIWDIIRKIGTTRGKPEKAKATKELIELLKKEGDLIKISQSLKDGHSNIETESEAFVTILSWGLSGPLAGFFASEVKFMFSSVYCAFASNVSEDNIQKLTTLTEKDLKSLKRLSDLMKEHVEKLKSARQTLNNLK